MQCALETLFPILLIIAQWFDTIIFLFRRRFISNINYGGVKITPRAFQFRKCDSFKTWQVFSHKIPIQKFQDGILVK